MGLFDKLNCGDRVLVSENRLMDVTEVKAPYLDVLIGGARNQERIVGRNVEAEDWERMAVEVEG